MYKTVDEQYYKYIIYLFIIRTNGCTGTILINNKPQDLEFFKKQSCYIMQEDQLHLQLTVRESMIFASKLKCFTFSLDANQLKIVKFEFLIVFIIIFLTLILY